MKVTIDLSDEAVADIRQAADNESKNPVCDTNSSTDSEVFLKLAAALPVREIRPGDRVYLKSHPEWAFLVVERSEPGEVMSHFPMVNARAIPQLGLWSEQKKRLEWNLLSSVTLIEGADNDH